MLSKEDITATLLSERLPLTAFVATVTRNYHMAEDVFQDVCVKAIGYEQGFESAAHLVNWARVAGRNRAIDQLRSRDGVYEGLSEQLLGELSAVWPESRESQSRRKQLALKDCVDLLTDNNREILRLRYFEGRSGSEVADLLGRKLTTVYQSLARIHKTLGDCVRKRMARLESEG